MPQYTTSMYTSSAWSGVRSMVIGLRPLKTEQVAPYILVGMISMG